jgi:hypothetical protein
MTLPHDPFSAYAVDPGGAARTGLLCIRPENGRQFLSDSRCRINTPQAITLLYNSWAAQVHAKVGLPRFFIQFGAWMLCGKTSRNRSHRR